MSEHDTIRQSPAPRTRASLAFDFRRLGIHPGMVVIVHSSLSSLGWVSGGPVAVVQALMDVLTPQGTLVMPTHSGDYSDPAKWAEPPVPEEWVDEIRASMPAYDPAFTPSRGMGRIPETFRTFPGVLRSSHPALSFAAWGLHAQEITENHSLDYSLGEQSPLARIYDLKGWVLLLGVGYGNNTSFHLAEYRAAHREETEEGTALMENGQRVWKNYRDIELNADIFPEIGADFEWTGHALIGEVGNAQARLFPQPEAVDFAVKWLNDHS